MVKTVTGKAAGFVEGGTNAMAAVKPVGSLSEEDVRAFLATLSQEDRAEIVIGAILQAQHGRKL